MLTGGRARRRRAADLATSCACARSSSSLPGSLTVRAIRDAGAEIAAEGLARLNRLADAGNDDAVIGLLRFRDAMAAEYGDDPLPFMLASTYDLDAA